MPSSEPDTEPTAFVIVSVHPTGIPAKIGLQVICQGTAKLTLPETAYILRSAADVIEQSPQAWQRQDPET